MEGMRVYAAIVLPVMVFGAIVSACFGSILPYPLGALALLATLYMPIYGTFVAWVTHKSL